MGNFLFHRCEMRHEKFSLSSDASDFSTTWKRNSLCPVELRSRNFLCTHGTALQRFLRENEQLDVDTRETLSRLQTQLFMIDHHKGDLEKYVFEKDDVQPKMKGQLKRLIREYHLIADQIQAILEELKHPEKVTAPSG
jgi:hypothetical protein